MPSAVSDRCVPLPATSAQPPPRTGFIQESGETGWLIAYLLLMSLVTGASASFSAQPLSGCTSDHVFLGVLQARKVTKAATKAVVGASLELIKQKRNQKPEVRAAAREAALREIKERAKAKQAAKAAAKPAKTQAAAPKAQAKAAPKSKASTNKMGAKGVRR